MNYFNYFSDIEAAFIRRRGKNLLLSPVDWALIESWQKRDIPLHIILKSIEDVFDAREKKGIQRTVKSLTYCKDEVETRYSEWLSAQVGKPPVDGESISETDDASIFEYLSGVLVKFKEASSNFADDAFPKAAEKLAALIAKGEKGEKLELELEKLDELIDEKLVELGSDGNMRRELEISMSEYKKKMDAASYKKTFDLMLVKKVREKTGVPRFSLYHL